MSNLEVTKYFDKLWLAWEPKSTWRTFLFVFKSLLNLLQYFFLMFWFSDCKACGILPPQPRMETTSPRLKGKVLITRLQGSPKKEDFDGSQHLTDIHILYIIFPYKGHSVFFHLMFVFLSVLSPGSLCYTFPLLHTETQDFNSRPFDWWIKKHYWNRSPAQAGCLRQVLGAGALGRPRGIRWRGRWEGGSGWGIHVTPWLIHVNVC